MEKIASFQIDHEKLLPGLYVSRKDHFGTVTLTTFDMRFKAPNREPVMDMPALHTLEHLAATYLRSDKTWSPHVVYFGPMGCRTGCYLILEGDLQSRDILELIKDSMRWILAYEGPVIAAAPKECGNWREHNLDTAKWECKRYLETLENATDKNLVYP